MLKEAVCVCGAERPGFILLFKFLGWPCLDSSLSFESSVSKVFGKMKEPIFQQFVLSLILNHFNAVFSLIS